MSRGQIPKSLLFIAHTKLQIPVNNFTIFDSIIQIYIFSQFIYITLHYPYLEVYQLYDINIFNFKFKF